VADAFIQQHADVILIGRHAETLRATAASLGSHASWHQADVAQSGQVRTMLDEVLKSTDHIDILVNAAGFTGTTLTSTPFEQAEHVWDEVVDVNLKGSFLSQRRLALRTLRIPTPADTSTQMNTPRSLLPFANCLTMRAMIQECHIHNRDSLQARYPFRARRVRLQPLALAAPRSLYSGHGNGPPPNAPATSTTAPPQ
jgi:NAD(P)-dependent dehydrogenase (short-subunit alcohol dehydrogenase family)